MIPCKTIAHTLTVEYKCPADEKTHRVTLVKPTIYEGSRYDDDYYRYINVKCVHCEKSHMLEID